MADTTTSTGLTLEQYEGVAALLDELKSRADAARTDQNPILLATYLDLLKICTPRVARLRSRLDRADLAGLNRSLKEQRKAAREALNGTGPNA